VTLDDGQKVGVSVGGHGVPLVFLHGLGLSGRAYVRLLSRLAGMGFLVVALDAAGHGGTPNLRRNAADLAHRVDLTMRTLDTLGIDKAVFAGHSMGGRMIIQLAAAAPRRVLAAVLLDAAAGAPFDDSIRWPARSPRRAVQTLLGAAYDAHGDPLRLPAPERNRYLRMMTSSLVRNVRTPFGFSGAFRAIIASGDYTPMLDAMREHRVPTIVVHGEKDLVVPFASAHDMAERADGALYRVPGAYHSWMLANPQGGADVMRQLLAAELGDALRASARANRVDGCVKCWADALLSGDSPLRPLADAPLDIVGTEASERASLDRLRTIPRKQGPRAWAHAEAGDWGTRKVPTRRRKWDVCVFSRRKGTTAPRAGTR
jgi:pimeloyl-ACP methyl ester carboxylesterase